MKMIEKAESGKRGENKTMNEKTKRENLDAAFIHFSTACVENAGKWFTFSLFSWIFSIEFAMAYYKRGKCYMLMHDYKRALYDFSAAILNETRYFNKQPYNIIKPEGGLALFFMYGGQCNYYLGQYEEALAHYEIAKSKDKDN